MTKLVCFASHIWGVMFLHNYRDVLCMLVAVWAEQERHILTAIQHSFLSSPQMTCPNLAVCVAPLSFNATPFARWSCQRLNSGVFARTRTVHVSGSHPCLVDYHSERKAVCLVCAHMQICVNSCVMLLTLLCKRCGGLNVCLCIL